MPKGFACPKNSMPNQFIIWDFDGTLAYREGMWSQAVVDVVNRNFKQINLVRADISNYLSSGFFWHSPDTAHLHVSNSAMWWEHHYRIFENAIVNATDLSSDSVRQVLPQIRQEFLDPFSWTVYSDVPFCLSQLASSGWRHMILSNHVPELTDLVRSLGLLDFFETIVTSAKIGYEKPNGMAFHAVIKNLPRNSRIWMIGDNYVADVLGANSVDINAILVRKSNAHADHFAATLEGVPGILESN